LAVSPEQLDPKDGREFEDRPDPDSGHASFNVSERDGRDTSALSQRCLGPASRPPGIGYVQAKDPDRVDRLR
jgi:hypothetical protein